MQSLIHGNFEGAAQKKAYALVGAAAAIAAAVGPLIGGFITTYLSWRVAFLLEDVIIIDGASRHQAREGRAVHRRRGTSTSSAQLLSIVGMGGIVLGILVWQEGGESVARLLVLGALARWPASRSGSCGASVRESRRCSIPTSSRRHCSARDLRTAAAADHAGRHDDRAPDLPADGARVQRDGSRPVAGSAFAEHVRVGVAGRETGRAPAPGRLIRAGFVLVTIGVLALIPIVPRADSGWYLVVPLIIAGSGLGLLVSQLNNYTLSPVSEERVSEAAGVNSAGGSFGLSFGLAFSGAIMLATLSFAFTNMAEDSHVLAPAEQQQVADALENDAEILSNTQLEEQLVGQPPDVQAEIIRINTDARRRALQVALLVPLISASSGWESPSAWCACRIRLRRAPPRAWPSADRPGRYPPFARLLDIASRPTETSDGRERAAKRWWQ